MAGFGGVEASNKISNAAYAHKLKMAQMQAELDKTNDLTKKDQLISEVNSRAKDVIKQNEIYRDMLARPLMDILDENANLKAAYEEQQELIALWMCRQRAMKKVALDLGKQVNVSEEKIISTVKENTEKIVNGNNLDGSVSDSNLKYFSKHKKYILDSNSK